MQVLPVLPQSCDGGRAGVECGLKLQTCHVSDKTFETYVAEIAEEPGQPERTDPINGEHVVQRGGVVGENHRPTLTGPPPEAILAERELPVSKVEAHISVQQAEATNGRDGNRRTSWPAVRAVEEIEHGGRGRWSRRCRLILSANVEDQRTCHGIAGGAVNGVETFFVGTAVVV